ncbi:MAG: hypothetical protein EWV76_22830 [Microcystis novacekii Mn_MB_F_20050700_S1]|uniref:Uncharacterized protein n=1 Tax=Microcystis novacekii Mn_MB_F_20050700_S1D TaxID=2486266 RepID=A0A552JAV8_9CHRO|nr:MAG: hypothetical protein EWV76_22830 [Microcystis novacekii Mn_MB_F_20050700_S1]TRU92797.1 MAG: hypothetical protein EWV54_02190 [Microcystis novacekii Mn_MB_F_20050700_S1D]
MVYLHILCHLIFILVVFKPSKINYARGLINYTYLTTFCTTTYYLITVYSVILSLILGKVANRLYR